jgi:hypothetical protein
MSWIRCSVFALAFVLLTTAVHAAPNFIPYSGRLTDGTGAGKSTTETLIVKLWACAKCGGEPWFEGMHEDVRIVDGYFSILIGEHDEAGNKAELPQTSKLHADLPEQIWLSVAIEGASGEALTRQPVGSVPYAIMANDVWKPKLAAGEVRNIGWFRSTAGEIEVKGSDGTALTSASPAWVGVPSSQTVGKTVTVAIASPVKLKSVSAATNVDISGWLFGVTDKRAWAEWMPVFLYVCNSNDTDAGVAVGLSRNPVLFAAPEAGLIGNLATPATESDQNNLLLATTEPISGFALKPCARVGAARMKKPGDDPKDWVLSDGDPSEGFGANAVARVAGQQYTMPTGQNGAEKRKHFAAANRVETSLTFTHDIVFYSLSPSGYVDVSVVLEDPTLFSTSISNFFVHSPYSYGVDSGPPGQRGFGACFINVGSGLQSCSMWAHAGTRIRVTLSGDNLRISHFSLADHHLKGSARYRAF